MPGLPSAGPALPRRVLLLTNCRCLCLFVCLVQPNLEWVAPVSVYVVKDGKKTHLDLSTIPVSRAWNPLKFLNIICHCDPLSDG